MPSLFISHGAPDLVLHDLPARRFLGTLGEALPRPAAICVASAHYAAPRAMATSGIAPRTVHDFGGFGAALHAIEYPARGQPALASRIVDMLGDAGFDACADAHGGFDHGVWCPLMLMYPQADVPVVALSVDPDRDAAWHLGLGRALARLRGEDVLLIGSGALTHNLHAVAGPAGNAQAPGWVDAFGDWVGARLAARDEAALVRYRDSAPAAADNHPSPEHLLPFFVALGAAGADWRATRLHHSVSYRALRMDAFRFDA